MIEKKQIDRLIDSTIGLELSDNNYYKGILREVSESSIVLEFLNGKRVIISLSKIVFVKVIE